MSATEEHEAKLRATAEREIARLGIASLTAPLYVVSWTALRRRSRIPDRSSIRRLEKEIDRLKKEWPAIAAGGLDAARKAVQGAGVADCVDVVATREELVTAIAARLRAGDNAWNDLGDPLLGLEFYRD